MTRIGSTARQISAVAFALLLVTSGLAGMVVPASALDSGVVIESFETDVGGLNEATQSTAWTSDGSYSAYVDNPSTTYDTNIGSAGLSADSVSWAIKWDNFSTGSGYTQFKIQDSGTSPITSSIFVRPDGTLEYWNSNDGYVDTGYNLVEGQAYRFRITDLKTSPTLTVYQGLGGDVVGTVSLPYQNGDPTDFSYFTPSYYDVQQFYLDDIRYDANAPVTKYTVSGVVTATGGSPLEGVTVTDGNGTSSVTDATGAYSMELPDGSYTLTASKSAYVDGSQSVSVSGSAVTQDFTLSPENTTINGSVEDQEGEPLTDSTITIEDGAGNVVDTTQSDALGDWSFAVGAGDYTVKAQKNLYADTQKSVSYDGVNVSSGHVLVQGRLGLWDAGLYGEMRPNYEGNLSGGIDYLCEFDPEGTYSTAFEAFWNWSGSDRDRYDVAGCEPDMASSTQLDMFHAAASLNQSEQEMFIVMSNRLQDTRGVAYTEAKIAAVEALNAGANQSEAQDAAREAVGEYYSTIQSNILTRWEAGTAQADYIEDARIDAGGTGWQYVQTSTGIHGDGGNAFDGKATATVTLADGTERTFTTFRTGTTVVTPLPTKTNSSEGTVADGYKVRVYSNEDRNASTVILPADQYQGILYEVEAQDDAVKANIGTLVSDVYNRYQAGEIDDTDLLSPVELASRAASNYDSTGYYSFAAAELSSLGYGGDMNASHVVTIESVNESTGAYENVTKEGTLFYTGDDLGNLSTGQRYVPSDYSGIFLLATAEGIMEINDPFTIDSAIDVTDGTELATTDLESYDYNTADAETLLLMLEELKDLRESIENSETQSSGGGGFNFGFDLSGFSIAGIPGAVVVGLVILGTVFLLGKTNGSGGRY